MLYDIVAVEARDNFFVSRTAWKGKQICLI